MDGEDEKFAHGANGTITTGTCKTARRRRIASHCEFAPHRYMEKNGEHIFTGVSEIKWSCELSTSKHGPGNALLIFLLCDGTGYNFSLTVPAAPVVDNPRCGGVRAGRIEEYPDATEHTGRAPRPI